MRRRFALAGGDDYELCFTAAASQRDAVLHAAQASGTIVTRIGTIDALQGLRIIDAGGALLDVRLNSFDHFATP